MTFDTKNLSGQFRILKQPVGSHRLHYLDNAATAQSPDCVIEAMARHDRTCRANVRRGIHHLSELADAAYEGARAEVARYLGGTDPQQIVFTGGTTAGLNLLARSLGQALGPGDEVVISELEHHSNIVPWQMLAQQRGIALKFLPVTESGGIDPESLDRLITPATRIVSVTHGSNVTGAPTDVAPIAALARKAGALLILDGAQTAPHGPLDPAALGADFYVFSGHKVYGPNGIGVLWGQKALLERLPPLFGGGEMIREVRRDGCDFLPPPHRFEAGTPPIAQAVGLAAALGWYRAQDREGIRVHLKRLSDRVLQGLALLDNGRSRIRILGPANGEPRLPLVSFSVQDIHPHDICQVLNDRHGVALRGGFHCAQPLHDRFGLEGTTRASLAAFNDDADIDAFFNGMEDCFGLLGG